MKRRILYLMVIITLCTGCERYLDMKSNATYVVPKSIFDAQALLDDTFVMNEGTVPTWGESVIDDFYLESDALIFYSGSDNLEFYKFSYPEYYGNSYDWGYAYRAIYNSNLALEIIKSIERNNQNKGAWDNVNGSALFYRGFYFYGLLTNFALAFDENTADRDLGIPLRLNTNFNEISQRSSIQDCFDQIIGDLERSIDFLPDYPSILTRPSKGAAYAMLAKVYLYMRNYEKALEYTNYALQLNSQLMDFKSDSDIKDENPIATPFAQYHKETIFYAEMRAGSFYVADRGTVDSLLYRSYSTADFRLNLFFNSVEDLPKFRGYYTGINRRFGGVSTNELFLTKAECLAKLDKNEEALDVMDKLLDKRIKDYERNEYFVSNISVLDFVRMERRKELIYRNSRFSDVKRYNKEGANIGIRRIVEGVEYFLEPNSSRYALPIPSDLIELTGMPQN